MGAATSPAAAEAVISGSWASTVAGEAAQEPSLRSGAARRLRSSGNIVSSASNTSRLPPVKLFLRFPYRDR